MIYPECKVFPLSIYNIYMKKIYIPLLILAVLLVWSYTTPNKMDTSPLTIGVSVPLSGDAAGLGEFLQNVSTMAIEKINSEGGVHGRMISPIYEDDACSPAKSVSAVRKLISVDAVKAIVISTCSGAVVPTVSIATENKVLLVSGVATSPTLTNSSPLFARTVPSDTSQGVALAEYASTKGFKNVSIIFENTDYPTSIQEAFVNTYSKSAGTVSLESFVPGTTDFRSILAKAKSTNPDALFLIPGSPAVADRLTNDFAKLNWNVPLLGGDIYSSNSEVVKKYKTVVEGMAIAEQRTGPDTPAYIEFRNAYKQRYGKDLLYESRAQAQYDLWFILRDGLEKFGEDPEKIASWMRTIKDYQGFAGGITIGANGDAIGGHTVKVLRNGKAEVY